MPGEEDTESEFEKDIFLSINLLRNDPRSFIPTVQRVNKKKLVNGSKGLRTIIQALKSMNKVPSVKFDEDANKAVRKNNKAICDIPSYSPPEDAGNLEKLREIIGEELSGAETTFYNYWSKSAEEFVALLLYKDFDKFTS